ncbi:MAG TPA: CPBP family intramembrane glutamic endopeptidase, partial [Candidatus Binataceae bacterium]
MSFTLRFTVVFFAGLLVAALIAPVAAVIVSHAGFHYPFQRIFDRVVIVSIFALIFASASKLRLMQLLRDAFAKPSRNAYNGLIGLAIALTAIAILFVAASLFASFGRSLADVAIHRFPKYLVASLAIAFMEEFFFRAILLGGIKRDFGATKALLASALIFAVVHMIKSAPHSYLTGFEPMAGIENLIENFALIGHKNFRLATL